MIIIQHRDYFIPGLILSILLAILFIYISIRDRKSSYLLYLIPLVIVALVDSPWVKRNSTLQTTFLVLTFISGIILISLKYKNKN
ncbi:hypothetical protein [Clostridium yunnanense]|uniref:hypothetical protein n=1 Tax=Clostridium yunnanense TaxID=2800325 RepID=UPI001A9C878F|nr:hypothetical protein [Clostridium yunnanense]